MAHGIPPRHQTRLLLFAFCGMLLAVANSLVPLDLWLTRQRLIADARHLTQSLSRSLEEHAARTVTGIDQLLLGLVDSLNRQIARKGPEALTTTDPEIESKLRHWVAFAPYPCAIFAVDRNGIMANRGKPGQTPVVDSSKRAYFTSHRDGQVSGLFIGTPEVGKISGNWALWFTRRLTDGDDRFAGVVNVSIDPAHIAQFYAALDIGQGVESTLVHESGIVMVAVANSPTAIGSDRANSPLFRTYLPRRPTGTFTETVNGDWRLTSYRKLAMWPLVVTSTISLDRALGGWWERVAYATIGLLLVNGTLLFFLFSLLRHLRREEEAVCLLQSSESRAVEARRQLLDAIESMTEGFVLFDRDEKLVLFNSKYREMVAPIAQHLRPGISYPEFVEHSVAAGLIVQSAGNPRQWVQDRLQAHRHPGPPTEQLLSSGRWILAWAVPTSDGGRVHIRTDITSFKQQQQELERRAVLMQTTVENIAQGICVFDADQRLVLYNRNWIQLLGLPDGFGRIGLPLVEVVRWRAQRGDYGDGETEAMVAARLTEICEPRITFSERRLPSGTMLDVRGVPMPDGSRLTTYTDITEHKRREDELQVATLNAERANQIKSLFLATMSHELRTPLNAIIGFSDIIAKKSMGEDQMALESYAGFAEDIFSSGRHLLDLLNNILDVSKIEAGRMTVMIERVDLLSVVASALNLTREQARSADVTVLRDLPKTIPEFYADERAVRQILSNLLSNAIKFTPAGGQITVTVRLAAAGGVDIIVADTGLGIPKDRIERVTQPFEQGDNSYNRAAGGTGLGLSLVKGLAELHGGSIRIASEVGVGTSVTVHLPTNFSGLRRDATVVAS